ncbi:MAG: anti-sigma factor family protein [Actinomycetota bacterium]
MMSCSKIQRAIQTYVDGTATQSERATVDEHVARCPRCSQTLAESRQLVQLLAATPSRSVSASFERNLALALRDATPVSQSASWWERFRVRFEWRLRFPAMVAAGSLAVGVLAAVVSPAYLERQEREQLRQGLVVSAVERHEQLERSSPNPNWDAVDGSIELTTGSIFTE